MIRYWFLFICILFLGCNAGKKSGGNLQTGDTDELDALDIISADKLGTLPDLENMKIEIDIDATYMDLSFLENVTNIKYLKIEIFESQCLENLEPLQYMIKKLQIRSIANGDVFLPLIESNTIKSLFIPEEFFGNDFPIKIFEDRGINVWTDGK